MIKPISIQTFHFEFPPAVTLQLFKTFAYFSIPINTSPLFKIPRGQYQLCFYTHASNIQDY